MGAFERCREGTALLCAASLFLALPRDAPAAAPETDQCLGCHGDPAVLEAAGEAARPPFVDGDLFAASAHAGPGCGGCHGGVYLSAHPDEDGPPAPPVSCGKCHQREKPGGRSAHDVLVRDADAPPCVRCHVPHGTRRVREWKPAVTVTIYCLTCHQEELSVFFEEGETLRLTISQAALGASVHLDHGCTDCHAGFSKAEHPLGRARTPAAARAEAGELCRKCHPEQYRLVEGSMHFAMLRYGHQGAPLCTDCHGHHSIAPTSLLETLAGTPCRRCHEEVYESFASTPHGLSPRRGGHFDAPLCSGCHRAHDVRFPSLRQKITEACLGCHDDAPALHRSWLPKVTTHFEAVACTACHVPEALSEMAASVYDLEEKRILGWGEVPRILGSGRAGPPGTIAQWRELVWELNLKGARGTRYTLSLSSTGASAHRLASKNEALRDCFRCHPASPEIMDKFYVVDPLRR